MTTLNAQMGKIDDPRRINPNKLMADYIVYRSDEGKYGDEESL